ncbi:MAG: hypothetical protein ABSB13_11735 [Candidatus Binatus sp.]|jgi:hypothetical protein|uniref:hypothetical protein n=1 Tax=Candidatus Binatus sp. TaxID=2811406 RepID=UPI003D1299AD
MALSGTQWKMPPLVKVYEALGAIGDGRVRIEDGRRATVVSSDESKTYEVETSADGREIASNDNASYWQGYVGYPAIAVLIARGFYRPPANVTDALAGVAWKELNGKFKNDWARTIAEVEKALEQAGHDPDAVRSEAEAVLSFLRELQPVHGKRIPPPAEKPAAKSRQQTPTGN